MNSRDLAALQDWLDEEAAFDFPGAGRITGRRRILTFLKALFRKYPRLDFTVQDTLIDPPRACVVWTNTGRHARGTSYRNSGVTIVYTRDGRITLISDYFKDTSFAGT